MKYTVEVTLDPPITAKEFGDWSGDPNIALKGKHSFVTITIEASAKPSLDWIVYKLMPHIDEYVITGYDENQEEDKH